MACNGVELNHDMGTLKAQALADKILIEYAIRAHIENVTGGASRCIDCFKVQDSRVFVIGKAFVGSERCAMLFRTCHGASPGAISSCSTATSHKGSSSALTGLVQRRHARLQWRVVGD